MWVRTLWPLSSSTRNMALGKGSTTVPSTSIASFFAKLPGTLPNTPKAAQACLPEPQQKYRRSTWKRLPGGQDLWTVIGDGDGVLEVRRQGSVRGDHGPAVGADLGPPVPHVDHRFDRHHQPGFDGRASARVPVVP